MSRAILPNAGLPAPPTVEVRVDGELIRRVSEGSADMLVSRGWAQWRGGGRRRHLELSPRAPVSAFPGWKGKDGTRAMRADQSCEKYGAGQVMGDPRSHREFVPG